jgi:probable phosphoglycerate mutase
MRCIETAGLAVEAMNIRRDLTILGGFREIDYGVDEDKTEEEVMFRLGNGNIEKGRLIIEAWNKKGIVPNGWNVDPWQIVNTWKNFAENEVPRHQTALLVTSNGIIRFAPCLTGNFGQFSQEHDLKVATGSLCIFEREDKEPFWTCTAWNIKPYK